MTHDEHVQRIKAESIREARDPKTRRILIALGVLMVVLIALVAVSTTIGYQALNRDVETNKQAAGVAAGTADTNKQAAEDLCAQIVALGKKCTTDPAELDTGAQAVEKVVGQQGIQGIQGVQGVQGVQGETGPALPEGTLMALIRRVLAENPPAPGKDGEPGAVGATGGEGATGQQGIPGQQGPKGDKGDQGDKGDKGDTVTGPAGRGISALSCQSLTLIELVVTYDDGVTQTVSCGGVAAPDPEPEP